MRLHQLTISNLNSLYGEHVIDFDGEMSAAPLFLISGPTGSGKSTILDAISLALFGETPRLNARSDEDASGGAQLIMSTGTGESRVVLRFSLLDADDVRRTYDAVWYSRRAYKKADGKLQNVERELYRVEPDGSVGETVVAGDKKTEHTAAFEPILRGLTADDFFTRVVLAQGSFAAFVKAGEKSRLKIMKRLVPLERFQPFITSVHTRYAEARAAFNKLNAQLEAGDETDPDAIPELVQLLREHEVAYDQCTKQLDIRQQEKAWLDKLNQLLAGDAEQRQELNRAQRKLAQLKPETERLASHNRAEAAVAIHQRLTARRESQKQKERDAAQLQERRNVLEVRRVQAEKAAEAAMQEADELSQGLDTLLPQLKQARAAHQAASQAKAAHKAAESERSAAEKNLSAVREAAASIQSRTNELERAQRALAEDRTNLQLLTASPDIDPRDTPQLRAWNQQHDTLKACAERFNQQKRQRAAATKSRESAEAMLAKRQNALRGLNEKGAELARERAQLCDRLGVERSATPEAIDETVAGLQTSVDRLQASLRDATDLVERLSSLRSSRQAARQESEKTLEGYREAQSKVESSEKAVENSERRLNDLQLVRSGDVARVRLFGDLQAGEPCPLCSSTDHDGSPDEAIRTLQASIAETDESIKVATSEVSAARAARECAQRDVKEAEAAHASSTQQHAQTSAAYDAAHTQLLGAFEEAKRHADEASRQSGRFKPESSAGDAASGSAVNLDPAALRDQLQPLRAVSASAEDTLKAWRAGAARVREIDTIRRNESEHLSQRTEELRNAEQAAEDAQNAEQDAQNEADRTEHALNEALASAREAATALIALPSEDDNGLLDGTIGERIERAIQDAAKLNKQQEKLASDQRTLASEAKSHGAQLAAAKKELERRTQKSAETEAFALEREQAAAAFFDGRSPDEVEQGARAELSNARKRTDSAQTALKDLSNALAAAGASLKERQRELSELSEEIGRLSADLRAAVESSGFASIDAARAARISDETAAAIQSQEDKARERLKSAKTLADVRHDELAAHRDACPEACVDVRAIAADGGDREDDSAYRTPKALQTKSSLVQDAVDELTETTRTLAERIGEATQQLKSARESQRKREELHAAHHKARATRDAWENLHKAYSVSEGEQFEEWLLALTFDQLLQHANSHLRTLRPRYRLKQRLEKGARTLDFTIVDREQAGAERSTNTLSGGETFLLSLSLALGLSELSAIRFRPETLLLDEGFGTLDAESLQDALRALEELRQTNGVRVGIISHVEALRSSPSIPVQIRLEALGQGRSTIRIAADARS